MTDLIALEQSDRLWHFLDLAACRRYWFAHYPRCDYGWLRCTVMWLPIVGDGLEDDGRAMMESLVMLEDEDALALLQAMRRRCGLAEVPPRVFGRDVAAAD